MSTPSTGNFTPNVQLTDTTAVNPMYVSGNGVYSVDPDTKNINILLLITIAFYTCMKTGDELAQAQQEGVTIANQIATQITKEISGYTYEQLPAGASTVTVGEIQINNQCVQAGINITQDYAGLIQNNSQTLSQQAQSTISGTMQTQSEYFSLTTLVQQVNQQIASA